MKNASSGFKTAIDQEVTYLCGLVEISRRDGHVYRFTDHDEDVVIGGNTYVATRGFTRSAIMNSLSAGLASVTLEILLADLAQEGLTEEQLRAGQFDDSLVTIYTADWRTPANGMVTEFNGRIFDIQITDKGYCRFELDGLFSDDSQIFIESYSPSCRADLGDSRCKVPIETLARNVIVTGVPEAGLTFTADELTEEDDYWQLGLCVWTSGANVGQPLEIRTSSQANKSVTLFLPTSAVIQVGDTARLYPGCDKQPHTCKNRYNNMINFRGEPFIPDTSAAGGGAATPLLPETTAPPGAGSSGLMYYYG